MPKEDKPKEDKEKDKKEKKEKKEDKDKKDSKEDNDKKEKKEKKEKKTEKEGGGFDLWTSAESSVGNAQFSQVAAPQDKRDKIKKVEDDKKKNADAGKNLIKASDAISQLLDKKKEQAKEKIKQQAEDSAKKLKAKRAQEERDEEEDESFQIMDRSGLGNFMDRSEVLEIMKNTVGTATSSSNTRCQVSTRTVIGDKIFTNKNVAFESLGDFRCNKGFIFIRGTKEEPGYTLQLVRPATVYVCLSKSPNADDPFLQTWENVAEDSLAFPELPDELAEIVEVKRKVCKRPEQRNVSVPKPPAGLEICLCFVQADFHADPFEQEEETEEELLAKNKREAAERRAGRSAGKEDKKQEGGAEEKMEEILEKVSKGVKLSNKEKKLHEKYLEKKEVFKNDDEQVIGDLKAFTLILEGGKNEPPPSADAFVCSNFKLTAPGQTLFDNASITIVQGKRYGILGPNGQGKTTILRHIAAREMPVPLNWDVILVEQEAKATERTAVEEVMAADTKTVELLQREDALLKKLEEIEVQMEKGEDVSTEELEDTRSELEAVSAELDASGAEAAEAKVRKILCGLGFTNGRPDEDRFSMDRPVVQFSGGWRMRISLAKALFLQPKLLMLDEPTNHLDLDAVLWLDEYLSEHYPHAVVVVSHDADFLDSICTDILHLEDKKLVHYRGDYTAFKKMHEQKRRGLDSEFKKQQDMLKALKKKGKTKEQAEEAVKQQFGIAQLDSLMEKHKDYVVKFNFVGHGMDRSLGLNVSEVAFSYDGKEPWLLEDCEIGVDCGSRIAIVGPNGAGKTTLLNLMMQHLEPCRGEVSVSKGIRVRQYHQHFEELLPLEKTGIEYLQSAFNLTNDEPRRYLGQFGLPGSSHHTKIGNLSGGQKARVAFAALMLMKPHIIILDEPTNHLDIESVEALTDAVSKFNGGLVLVTHDARLITSVDCDLWVCEDGGCYRFEKDFEGYRQKVLKKLAERQEEVERLDKLRREARVAKRAKHVSQERLEKAAKEVATRQAVEAEEKRHADEGKAKRRADEVEAKKCEEAEVQKRESQHDSEQEEEDEEKGDTDEDEKGEEVKTAAQKTKEHEQKQETHKQAKEEEEEDEEEEEREEEDDKDEAEKAEESEEQDVHARNDALKIAEVAGVRALKKKKGFFLCHVDVGQDDDVPIVSSLQNIQAGAKVIVALEGCTLAGKTVEGLHLHGEWSAGVICSPADLGWPGNVNHCIILKDSCEVGSSAPASAKSPLVRREEEGADDSEADEQLGPAPAANLQGNKGKARDEAEEEVQPVAKARGKKGKAKEEEEEEVVPAAKAPGKKGKAKDEEDDDDTQPAAKARGKKGKANTKDDDDDDDDIDVPVPTAVGKKGKANKNNEEDDQVPVDKKKLKKEEDDADEDEDAVPAAKARGKKAKAATQDEDDDDDVHAAKARGKKGKAKKDDDDEDDAVPVAKARGKKGKPEDDENKVPAAKARGKKGKAKRDEDDEDEDQVAPTAKARGKKGKAAQRDDNDDSEEDDQVPAAKARGKKGKAKTKDSDNEDPAPAARPPVKPGKGNVEAEEEDQEENQDDKEIDKKIRESAEDPDAKHREYKVARVLSADPMKKKKGFILVELETGGEKVSVATSYSNVDVGQKVILAPEGSTVSGKEVKRQKIGGDWVAGVICGPVEMGWPGDASSCTVLGAGCKVGDFAPAHPSGASPEAAEESEDEDEPKVAARRGGKQGKPAFSALADTDEEEAEEGSEDDRGGGKQNHLPATKAQGKKGKAKQEEDEGEESDEGDRRGKKKGASAPKPHAKKGKAKQEEDEEKEDSDGDDRRGKKKDAPKSQGAKGKAKAKEEEDEEDDTKGSKTKAAAKAQGKKSKAKKESEDENSDEDGRRGGKAKPAAKVQGKKGKAKKEEEDEDSQEEEKKGSKTKAAAKAQGKKSQMKKEEDEEDSEEDDRRGGKAKAAAKVQGKKGKANKEDDEDEHSDEGDRRGGKAKAAAKAQGRKGKANKELDEDEHSDEDDRRGGKAKAAAKAQGKKGKAKNDEDDTPAKPAEDESDDDGRGKKEKRGKKK